MRAVRAGRTKASEGVEDSCVKSERANKRKGGFLRSFVAPLVMLPGRCCACPGLVYSTPLAWAVGDPRGKTLGARSLRRGKNIPSDDASPGLRLGGGWGFFLKKAWLDHVYDDKAMAVFSKDAAIVVD